MEKDDLDALARALRDKSLTLEFAETSKIERYRPEVDRILMAAGHPEAWVSDASTLDTLYTFIDAEAGYTDRDGFHHDWTPEQKAEIRAEERSPDAIAADLRAALGVPLGLDEEIWRIAKRLHIAGLPPSPDPPLM